VNDFLLTLYTLWFFASGAVFIFTFYDQSFIRSLVFALIWPVLIFLYAIKIFQEEWHK
jgi:hypothetical protein